MAHARASEVCSQIIHASSLLLDSQISTAPSLASSRTTTNERDDMDAGSPFNPRCYLGCSAICATSSRIRAWSSSKNYTRFCDCEFCQAPWEVWIARWSLSSGRASRGPVGDVSQDLFELFLICSFEYDLISRSHPLRAFS